MKKQLDIKKLLILNLPYILMGLFATNFGEAWRMAQGADASQKALSLISVLPVALASWWPSLHPLDLLVGICCGGGLRLAVYLKSKNAKKYRHGMEYGSARWGTHEDIAPYVDPVFQNNVILTKTESLTMNSRPKDPKTARNKNVLVIGGSGSGKTRFWLKPNLMQMHSSYVVTDPKGTILVECGKMLQRGTPKMRPKLGKDHQPVKDRHGNPVYETVKDKNGKVVYEPYRIKVLNTINFKKSMHYNPFAYLHSEKDILKLVTTLIANTKGEGKAGDDFWVKAEILDPEAEYAPLVERLHGQVIKISPTSTNYINPMDLNLDYSDDESPLSLKSDFILSLCELIVGGKEGLQPVQKTIIDRCVRLVYQDYLNDPRPENMPILEDLYNLLRAQDEKEAQYIATALEIYVTGSLNVFNHQTNVDINNRIVCYDIKELGKQLKKIGMLVVQDQVWNRVTVNRAAHKSTRYYIDEMHLLLKEEQTAAYTVEIWKRFRKWGGIPTGITQNVKDLLSSREVENIFENSDFVYMLNQAGGDRQILAKQLGISPHQLSYVTHSGEGEGLLFYGSTILPFVDHFPKNTELYAIMTTKPLDLKKEDEQHDKERN